jgi:hypothetical protein
MTISAIREVIEAAQWNNLDFQGYTREEFARANVPAVMLAQIARLDAHYKTFRGVSALLGVLGVAA